MINILFGNVRSKIYGYLPQEVLKVLEDTLSYEVEGAFFSPKFQSKVWDGRKRLFSVKTQSFPTGLFPRIRTILQSYHIESQITDTRQKPLLGEPLSLHNLIPREYQEKSANDLVTATRGICKVGTGGGKSIILCALIAKLNLKTMIYVHKKDLHQAYLLIL